jgi:hypothetical protein
MCDGNAPRLAAPPFEGTGHGVPNKYPKTQPCNTQISRHKKPKTSFTRSRGPERLN